MILAIGKIWSFNLTSNKLLSQVVNAEEVL